MSGTDEPAASPLPGVGDNGTDITQRRIARATYSLAELAILLGVSKPTAYRTALANELPIPVIRVGARLVFSRVAVDKLLAGDVAHLPGAPS